MRKLPEQLLNSLTDLPGFDQEAFIASHGVRNKITSIRLNPFKPADLDFAISSPVPWSAYGFYLEERPSFTYDPLFHAGCYYVQEAGSMFLEEALKQTMDLSQPVRALDISAAPGGKSTLLNSLLHPDSLLVANEVVRGRAATLAYNLSKWGTINTVVTNNDTERFSHLEGFFDLLVADVPCSGSGLFRKQPEAIDDWSPEHVTACSIRQRKILEEITGCLKQGGVLFYSTCSYSVEENEEVVNWLISEKKMELLTLRLENEWGITDSGRGYRFYPHRTSSEGFFCAVLRQTKNEAGSQTRNKDHIQEAGRKDAEKFLDFLPETNGVLFELNGQYHFSGRSVFQFISNQQKNFYFRKAGLVAGEIKGRDIVPNHDLALCAGDLAKIRSLDLEREDALRFLKKENFSASETIKGFCRITYKSHGLGWAKLLPNRINNYLPNELRILK